MAKFFSMCTKSEQKLVQRFTGVISNFDDFKVEIKWIINDVDRYKEIVSMFPYSTIGFKRHDWIKKCIQVELWKSIKDISKSLEKQFYWEIILELNKKLEIKWYWFDAYISISERN